MEANKCVGILTSGGDAPGMNAAIRAVTRAAIYNGFEVKGIMRGYRGLITDEIVPFQTQNVSNIIQQGGTILKTARCEEFRTPEGRKTAYDNIVKHGITSLVVIGGDGSLTGREVSTCGSFSRLLGRTRVISDGSVGSICCSTRTVEGCGCPIAMADPLRRASCTARLNWARISASFCVTSRNTLRLITFTPVPWAARIAWLLPMVMLSRK